MRPGSTLVEALVALVLFQIGVLALAATTATAARDLGVANRRSRAQAVAEHRVALLRAGACPSPTSGMRDLPGGLSERWRIDASGAVRVISDSVAFPGASGRTSSVVARGFTLCAE